MDAGVCGASLAQDGMQRLDHDAEQQGQELWPKVPTLSSPRSLFLSEEIHQGCFDNADRDEGNESTDAANNGALPGLQPSAALFGVAALPPFFAAESSSEFESLGSSEMNHAAELFSPCRDNAGEDEQGTVSLKNSEKPDDLFVGLSPQIPPP